MDYIEFDLDSAVSTLSAFTAYSSLDTPTFSMGRNIQNVVGFKIIESNIPSSYFVINDEKQGNGLPNNYINFLDLSGEIFTGPIVIPVKNYTGPELASTIATLMNASFGAGLFGPLTTTCTYEPNGSKFTIAIHSQDPTISVVNLEMLFASNDLPTILGFSTPDKLGPQSYTVSSNQDWVFVSSSTALVTGPNYFQINSLKLANVLNNYTPEGPLGTIGQTDPTICQVPIYMAYGGLNQWQSTQPDTFDTQNLFQLETFDLYLTLGTSKIPLKLNGLSWQCKVRVFIETNTVGQSLAGNVEQGRVVKRIRQT